MTEFERVKEIRKSKSLTMEEFGKKIGVGKTAISKIESGDRGITDQMCRSICREFGISETWLRTGEGDMYEVGPEDDIAKILVKYKLPLEMRGLFQLYSELSENAQEEVCGMIRKWREEFSVQNKVELAQHSDRLEELRAQLAETQARIADLEARQETASAGEHSETWDGKTREQLHAELDQRLDEEKGRALSHTSAGGPLDMMEAG